ncbi:hypothetical protein BBO99_00004175 [Phytophthora kernoviae]|uniref:Chromo domain-containing protein n=2 Tax=Phytophthora kernoviae TaxID=325452 RepID=A0A421FED4_9STRA|nr:hypothetical protein G195_007889 [Phytophthora kernoviae 00238/432]KAG2521865.1 hypothetical protein JM18_006402 [Phytophthora kernoviae]RLN38481.1 hypothetical protein BBI17_004809 [Phytophthora kernoviae]RLN80878.1 hypothetical protein BBO99_00004175 [Phytophthora kernoviae]
MATAEEKPDREKEFFMAWLQLMERQKEGVELSQTLQCLLTETANPISILAKVQKQANSVIANDQKMTELVAQINEYFFRDIVPELKRAKQVDLSSVSPQDALDQYLQHGDETSTSSQDFVDNMSGWEVSACPLERPCGQDAYDNNNTSGRKKKKRDSSYILQGPEDGDGMEDNLSSDDDIPSDKFHDLLIANGIKLTSMQAPEYAAPSPVGQLQPGAAQVDAAARLNRPAAKTKTRKRSRMVPPPIVTDLPNRSRSVSTTSTPCTQSQSPEGAYKHDRIGKQIAANLVAEQVLGTRPRGHNKEFQIRWQGVAAPLWITRRRAPGQARALIDEYMRGVRAQEEALASARSGVQSRGKKHAAVKHATNFQKKRTTSEVTAGGAAKGEPVFYTVDHIVSHKMHYSKRLYLVRWENYDESENTWEEAAKLRADIPDIVDEYEQRLERELAVQSAISELTRDASVESLPIAKKRVIGETEEAKEVDGAGTAGATSVGSKQLVVTEKEPVEGKNAVAKRQRIGDEKEGESSDESYQFDSEEAELEEFRDDEFSDNLNI